MTVCDRAVTVNDAEKARFYAGVAVVTVVTVILGKYIKIKKIWIYT